MLPLDIQMQIDLSAMAHSREIAEGFAKARERLLPAIPESPLALWQRMLMNAAPALQGGMHPGLLGANAQGLFWAQSQNFGIPLGAGLPW